MKKLYLLILIGIFLSAPSMAQEKLLVIYLHHKNSPYLEKINNKILKNKYLAKRIKKSFDFRKIQLDTPEGKNFAKRFNISQKEGVYFIDPSSGKILYSLTDLSQPCRCANLINYFSRNLHKKGINPDRYLYMAEKIGAYTKKVEKDYIF